MYVIKSGITLGNVLFPNKEEQIVSSFNCRLNSPATLARRSKVGSRGRTDGLSFTFPNKLRRHNVLEKKQTTQRQQGFALTPFLPAGND